MAGKCESMKPLVRAGIGLSVVALAGALGFWLWSRPPGPRAVSPPPPAPASATTPSPAALELMPADIVLVTEGPLSRSIDVAGSVQAVRSALVKAKVAGEIVAIEAREGEAVRVGQTLVRQDATDADLRLRQAQQQVASAQAQLDIARRALTNNQALVAQGFISPTALETSVSNETAAQATLKAAQLAADLAARARDDTVLRAPMSGIVAQRHAQPGERVSVDARLLDLVDLSQLEVEVAVPPDEAALLKPGASARLRVEGVDIELSARVVRISPRAQTGSRAVLTYLSLTPHPALRQGLFASGRIDGQSRQAVSVPASAVRVDRPLPYVIVLEGDRLAARTVRTGATGRTADGDRLEILEGLAAGDRVLAGTVRVVAEGRRWRAASVPASAPAR